MAPPRKHLDPSVDSVESKFRAAVAEQKDIFTLSALAHLLSDLGRNGEAASLFEEALECRPHHATKNGSPSCEDEARGLVMGLYAASVEGEGSAGAAKAETLYRGALRMNERDALAMGNYAVFLHRIKGDHRAAAAAYKKAVEVHPTHSSILCKYGGFVKHVENDYDKAGKLFEAAIAANPAHAESLGNLAVLLHGRPCTSAGMLDKIEALYKRAVHADPVNANNFSNFGLFLAEKRADFVGAETLYKKAGAIDPFHANSIYNYAVLLDSSLKQHERADDMYRRCLAVNPEHSYALYNLAVLKEEMTTDGDYSEVKQLFERAVRASPSDALTRADYGRFLALVENNLGGALENLREAIRCDPDCTTAQFNLGKLLLRRGCKQLVGRGHTNIRDETGADDRAEGKLLLRAVVRENEEHFGARLCLAHALAEEGDFEEAADLCASVLKGTSCTDVAALSNLAALLGRKGMPDKVVTTADDLLRRAISLSPSNQDLLRQQLGFFEVVKRDKRGSQVALNECRSLTKHRNSRKS
ncbi:unnamed protein product, partial [Scytosiphon promiscuus]